MASKQVNMSQEIMSKDTQNMSYDTNQSKEIMTTDTSQNMSYDRPSPNMSYDRQRKTPVQTQPQKTLVQQKIENARSKNRSIFGKLPSKRTIFW